MPSTRDLLRTRSSSTCRASAAARPCAMPASSCARARCSASPASSAPGAPSFCGSSPVSTGRRRRDPDRGTPPRAGQSAGRDRRRPRPAAGGAQARRHRGAPLDPLQHRAVVHAPVLAPRLRPPARARRGERGADARPEPSAARHRPADRPVQRRQPAEGDHRPLDRGRVRASSCSTSRRAASTSAPRPRSTP